MVLAPTQPLALRKGDMLSRGLIGAWLPGSQYMGLSKCPDLSGYGYHGTLENYSTNNVRVGKYGRSLLFTAASTHRIALGNIPAYNFGANQSFSVVVVFKPITLDTNTRRLVAKRTSGSNPQKGWSLWLQGTSSDVRGSIDDGTNTVANGAGLVVTANRWYVGGMVIDRASQLMRTWLSGYGAGAAADISSVGSLDTSNVAYIGSRSGTASSTLQFGGEISAVYIYARTLQQAEWSRLFSDPYVMFRPQRVWGYVPAGGEDLTRTLTESLGFAESIAHSQAKVLTEEVRLSDLLQNENGKRLVEALAYVDTLSMITGKNLLEQLGIADVVGKLPGKNLTEIMALADTRSVSIGKVLAEVVALADSLSKSPAIMLTEGLIFSDLLEAVLNGEGQAHIKELVEILGLADSLQKASGVLLQDILAVADALAKEPSKDVHDVLGMLDFLEKSPSLRKIEQLFMSESMSKLITLTKVDELRVGDRLEKLTGIMLEDVLAFTDTVSSQFVQLVGLIKLLQLMIRVSQLENILFEVSRLDMVQFTKSQLTNIKWRT